MSLAISLLYFSFNFLKAYYNKKDKNIKLLKTLAINYGYNE